MYLIGIGHRSDHGKDTLANVMVSTLQESGLRVKKIPWAWKLKDICYQLYAHFGLREPEFYETPEGRSVRNVKLPDINLTPVEIWIKVGTPAIRDNVWDSTWVDYLRLSNESKTYDVIVAPDTRFYNEIDVCDYTIKLTNPRIPNREGESVDEILKNYNGWHFNMENDTTLGDLEAKGRMLATLLLKQPRLLALLR